MKRAAKLTAFESRVLPVAAWFLAASRCFGSVAGPSKLGGLSALSGLGALSHLCGLTWLAGPLGHLHVGCMLDASCLQPHVAYLQASLQVPQVASARLRPAGLASGRKSQF